MRIMKKIWITKRFMHLQGVGETFMSVDIGSRTVDLYWCSNSIVLTLMVLSDAIITNRHKLDLYQLSYTHHRLVRLQCRPSIYTLMHGMQLLNKHHYRPQTKFAKVMFLQVSVCPQWGWGHAWFPWGMCMVAGWGGACVVARGMCMVARGVRGCWGACMVARGHAWLLGGHTCLPRSMHGEGGMLGKGGLHSKGGHAW